MSDSDKVCKIINCEHYSDCVCAFCVCLEKAYNKGRRDAESKWKDLPNSYADRLAEISYQRGRRDAMRWIPCSERLPEDRRVVLVTAYWHETYQVMEASYYGDGLWWCVPYNNCGEHMQRFNQKAWIPLPEPYKEQTKGEQENECMGKNK